MTVAERRHLAVNDPRTSWEDVDWSRYEKDASVDGRRLHYVDYGAGTPILLLHGLGMSWQWWLEALPALGRDHRVIALDLSGFGLSDALSLPDMDAHAERLLALAAELDLDALTVIGHSMGGLITLAMAEQAPERVARVVLVNAGGVPLSELRLRMVVGIVGIVCALISQPAVARALARRPKLRRAVLAVGLHNADAVTPALAAQIMPNLPGVGFLDAIGAAARRVRRGVVPVDCPVLLIWGAHDRLLPLSAARQLASALSEARLEILDGAGHTPMVEQPGVFSRLVLDFCRETI